MSLKNMRMKVDGGFRKSLGKFIIDAESKIDRSLLDQIRENINEMIWEQFGSLVDVNHRVFKEWSC